MAYRTAQEKIDSLTMQINNPNVVGSGYIEHPPQVPFGGKLLMQPLSVVDGKDNPEWMNMAPRGALAAQHHHDYQHATSRNGRLEHSHAVAGHRPKNMQNHNLGRESSDRYVPTSSAASNQRPPPLSSDIMPSRQEVSSGGGPQGRPQGIYNPQHMGHPTSVRHQNGFDVTAASTKAVTTVNSEASVVVPKSEMQDNDKTGVDEPKKLTKSQKAKLRKKLREGKA